MTFWDWALEAYARPDVEPACLNLQDNHGQSVAYLLWAAWAAGEGRVLAVDVLQAGARLAARWDAEVLSGLRLARRNIKAGFEGLDDDARQVLGSKIKALELKAEQTVMLALERSAPEPPGDPQAVEPALMAATGVWDFAAPLQPVRRLAQALS